MNEREKNIKKRVDNESLGYVFNEKNTLSKEESERLQLESEKQTLINLKNRVEKIGKEKEDSV